MKEVNLKILLNFAGALFMLQNVSAMDMSSSGSADEIPASATITSDFDLEKHIKDGDWSGISSEYQVRQRYFKGIRAVFTEFLDKVKNPAEAFENEMVECGIDKNAVQNLSNASPDFAKVESEPFYQAFENVIKTEFPKLKASLQPYGRINGLPPFARELRNPLRLAAYARISCMGCADSVYHLVLLLDQALEMLIDNPFMILPVSVTNEFKQISEKADLPNVVTNESTYVPHAIKIATSLEILSKNIDDISKEKGTRVVTPKDARQIRKILEGLLGRQDVGVDNSLMFTALDLINKNEGKSLNDLKISLEPIWEKNPGMKSIFFTIINYVLFPPALASAPTSAADGITLTPDQLVMDITAQQFEKFIAAVDALRQGAISSGSSFASNQYFGLIGKLSSLGKGSKLKISIGDIVSTIDNYKAPKIDKGAVKQALLDLL